MRNRFNAIYERPGWVRGVAAATTILAPAALLGTACSSDGGGGAPSTSPAAATSPARPGSTSPSPSPEVVPRVTRLDAAYLSAIIARIGRGCLDQKGAKVITGPENNGTTLVKVDDEERGNKWQCVVTEADTATGTERIVRVDMHNSDGYVAGLGVTGINHEGRPEGFAAEVGTPIASERVSISADGDLPPGVSRAAAEAVVSKAELLIANMEAWSPVG